MRAVWLLLQASAAEWKNRRNIMFCVVLILGMIGIVCCVREQGIRTSESGKIALGVAKEDTSEYANLLMKYFNENKVFLNYVDLTEAEEQTLKNALEQAELDAYLVIPKDFAQSMIAMENLPIRARVSMKNPTKALILRHVMEAYETYVEAVEVNCTALYRRMKADGFSSKEINAANVEISLDLIFTTLGKDDFFRQRVVETQEQKALPLMEHYQYTGVYFILLFLFIPAGLRMLFLRKNGLLYRLKAVNIPESAVAITVGIPYLLLCALLLALVCYWKDGPERFFPAFFLIIPWLVVCILLGRFCSDNRQYLFVCSMLLVGLAVLGGSLIPEVYLPDNFQKIAVWMPNRMFTYVMGGVQP